MQKLSKKNNFQLNYPDLAKEWHPTKNKIKPNQIQARSGKKFWFICPRCKHEYKKILATRTLFGTGCTICNRGNARISKNQLRFYCELKKIFKEVEIESLLKGDLFKKGNFSLDIYIKNINLGLEYDGSRFHKLPKNIKNDLKKNTMLKKLGIFLIRVRQEPLKKLNEQDIIVSQKLTTFEDVKAFLLSVKKHKHLQNDQNSKIDEYIKNGKFINDKDYRKYVSSYPNPIYKSTLEYKYPSIAKEWDYDANYPFKPNQIGAGMGHTVIHLICNNCSEKYKIFLGARIKRFKRGGKYCDNCNTLEKNHPKFLDKYWDYDKNNEDPKKVHQGAHRSFWFKCYGSEIPHSHFLDLRSFLAQKNKYCISCLKNKNLYKRRKNNFFIVFPELKKELSPKRNKDIKLEDVYKTDEKRLYWICKKGHEYKMNARTKYQHHIKNEICCPKCLIKFQKIQRRRKNSLLITHPNLCKDWHPRKNKNLKPEMFTKSSHQEIYWLCHICKNESKARIVNRAKTGRSRFCKSH